MAGVMWLIALAPHILGPHVFSQRPLWYGGVFACVVIFAQANSVKSLFCANFFVNCVAFMLYLDRIDDWFLVYIGTFSLCVGVGVLAYGSYVWW